MKNLLLKNSKRLAFLALCTLGCLCTQAQISEKLLEENAQQAIRFALRDDIAQACKRFEAATGCKALVRSFLDGRYSERSVANVITPIFKGLAQLAAARENIVSINVAWKGSMSYADSITVKVNVDTGMFAAGALSAFRDTLERYRETVTEISSAKAHERIIAALGMLQQKNLI